MKVVLLAESKIVPWFGEHSGYGRLLPFISRIHPETRIIYTRYDTPHRVIGKAYSLYHGWFSRPDSVHSAAELRLSLAMRAGMNPVFHIMHAEYHYYFLGRWVKAPKNIVGTIHHPFERISEPKIDNIRRLSSAIVMSNQEVKKFEEVGIEKVRFIHHGVDTEFFKPVKSVFSKDKRILFSGSDYGRNTAMLHRVIMKLLEGYPDLRFDLVVPEQFRDAAGLSELKGSSHVRWHQNLPDEELLSLYQKSYLILLPMDYSVANNTIVEALACGVPVVTTDVGGVRDYGGGSVYPTVQNDDDNGMIELMEKYLGEQGWRSKIADGCRKFAEEKLAWPLVAEEHLNFYNSLTE